MSEVACDACLVVLAHNEHGAVGLERLLLASLAECELGRVERWQLASGLDRGLGWLLRLGLLGRRLLGLVACALSRMLGHADSHRLFFLRRTLLPGPFASHLRNILICEHLY